MKLIQLFSSTLMLFIICVCQAKGVDIQPIYISLGEDCQQSVATRHYGRRLVAYPLDWVITFNFKKINELFQNGFSGFLHPIYLEPKKLDCMETYYLYNYYYQIMFTHDFPSEKNHELIEREDATYSGNILPNYIEFLPLVFQKYKRRINRLVEVLEGDSPIIFIRTATHNEYKTNLNIIDVYKFTKIIKRKYPSLVFILAVLHNRKEFEFEWGLENVINIYHPSPDSWLKLDEWPFLFELIESKLNKNNLVEV